RDQGLSWASGPADFNDRCDEGKEEEFMIEKLGEHQTQDAAAKFAGKYVEERDKASKNLADRGLILNVVAHGHYMGTRHYESIHTPWRFWLFTGSNASPNLSENALEMYSIEAGHKYVEKKGYGRQTVYTRGLIRACIAYGFKAGFRWRSECK